MKKTLLVTAGAIAISTALAMGVRKGLQFIAAKKAEREYEEESL